MAETHILVAEDQATYLGFLFIALEQAGYTVRVVDSGAAALVSAQRELPDLILLDVMMPNLDGFETCRRLKADPATRDVPVIFMTALADAVNETAGLQLGAVDYITKPIQLETALARVRTHLTMRQLQQALQRQNRELDAYARTVAHDLKSPVTAIIGAAQLLAAHFDTAPRAELRAYVDLIGKAGQRVAITIDELLTLAGIERTAVTIQPLAMGAIVERACERLRLMIGDYGAELLLPASWPTALGHAPWIELVWTNYLSNGLKYGGKPPRLSLGAEPAGEGMIRCWVQDNGPGLSTEERAQLFTEWTRLHPGATNGHGLGLAIVRRIVERLGGSVGVESEAGRGSRFFFTLPAGRAG